MFGSHFYHSRIRNTVALFGAMFNNIHVLRKDAAGNVISTVRVPLSYGPKQKYLDRIRESPDLDTDTKTSIKLPRMSFEMISLQYDPTRMVPKTNSFMRSSTDVNKSNKFYTGVPYTLYFQLNAWAKNQDDGLQIVEQILPYFNPQYTLTIKPFSDHNDIIEDVPITLVSTSFMDDYESMLEQKRTLQYTFEFEVKVMFYGPIGDRSIIREATTNFYSIGNDSDTPVSKLVTSLDPIDVSQDSDYGFTEVWTDYIG